MNTLPTGSYPPSRDGGKQLRRNAIVKNRRRQLTVPRSKDRQVQVRRRNPSRRHSCPTNGPPIIPREIVVPGRASPKFSARSGSSLQSARSWSPKASRCNSSGDDPHRKRKESQKDEETTLLPLNDLAMMLSDHVTNAMRDGLFERQRHQEKKRNVRSDYDEGVSLAGRVR